MARDKTSFVFVDGQQGIILYPEEGDAYINIDNASKDILRLTKDFSNVAIMAISPEANFHIDYKSKCITMIKTLPLLPSVKFVMEFMGKALPKHITFIHMPPDTDRRTLKRIGEELEHLRSVQEEKLRAGLRTRTTMPESSNQNMMLA